MHTSKAWPPGWKIDGRCFVYAVVKHEPPTGLEALYFVLPPEREEGMGDPGDFVARHGYFFGGPPEIGQSTTVTP